MPDQLLQNDSTPLGVVVTLGTCPQTVQKCVNIRGCDGHTANISKNRFRHDYKPFSCGDKLACNDDNIRAATPKVELGEVPPLFALFCLYHTIYPDILQVFKRIKFLCLTEKSIRVILSNIS